MKNTKLLAMALAVAIAGTVSSSIEAVYYLKNSGLLKGAITFRVHYDTGNGDNVTVEHNQSFRFDPRGKKAVKFEVLRCCSVEVPYGKLYNIALVEYKDTDINDKNRIGTTKRIKLYNAAGQEIS